MSCHGSCLSLPIKNHFSCNSRSVSSVPHMSQTGYTVAGNAGTHTMSRTAYTIQSKPCCKASKRRTRGARITCGGLQEQRCPGTRGKGRPGSPGGTGWSCLCHPGSSYQRWPLPTLLDLPPHRDLHSTQAIHQLLHIRLLQPVQPHHCAARSCDSLHIDVQQHKCQQMMQSVLWL
jgi:hypothetical protein